MKKITILLVMLFMLTFSYSQLIYVEGFGTNVLPPGWTMTIQDIGTGTQQWTFGSGVVPGSVDDFTSSAAIFDDDTAGNTGNHDNVILWTGSDTGSGFDLSTNDNVTLSYEYALNVLDGGSETLSVVIWDNANTEWITLVEYNTDTNPTLDSVDITAAMNTYPGISAGAVFIGFEYDDANSAWAWGAGVDNVKIRLTPANDACANAEVITDGATIFASNTQASDLEGGVTPCNGGGGNGACSTGGQGVITNEEGVWYVYTSTSTETITVSTDNAGTDFDTEIQVKTTCGSASTCVGADDDGGSNFSSIFCWLSTGTFSNPVDYYIYIDGHNGDLGDFELTLVTDQSTVTVPVNDVCVNAQIITDGDTEIGTTNGATDVDALTPCSDGGGDGSCSDGGSGATNFGLGVWYKYTSTSTETITISTANVGTDYDTELQVWSGACGTLTCVGGDDDGGDGTGSAFDSQFCWQSAGSSSVPVDYYIYVDGHNTNIGNYVLTLNADQSTVSTQNFEQFGFSIYPNPVNNILSIDSQEIINKVSIFNLLGQEVRTSNPETNNVSVDVNNLDSGVYIIKLVAGDKKSTKKFIKK